MIEKKISYNEPKPTKVSNTKPVMQGGRLNYLGKQKTITAPVKWKSGPTHPVTHLAYISDEEEKVLVKLNMYKSMNGKPNKGPFGIVSLNDGDGSGGNDGGASGGSGGSGGSDAAGNAGNATGDSGGVAGSGGSSGPGGGSGPGGEAGTGGADSGPGAGPGSPGTEDAVADNAAAQAQAVAEQTVTNTPMEEIEAAPAPNVIDGIMGLATKAMQTYMAFSPTAMAVKAIANAISNAQRGVTAPNDYSQLTDSVQSNAPTQSPGGGSSYLPINANTGIPSLSISSDLVDDFYNRYKLNLNRFQ